MLYCKHIQFRIVLIGNDGKLISGVINCTMVPRNTCYSFQFLMIKMMMMMIMIWLLQALCSKILVEVDMMPSEQIKLAANCLAEPISPKCKGCLSHCCREETDDNKAL